jgi:GT2 family glycosyltransferase
LGVARRHRHIHDPRPLYIEPDQQVGFEEKSGRQPRERNPFQDFGLRREETIHGIEDVPIAGGELRQEGEADVADEPPLGHRAELPEVVEPAPLGMVCDAFQKRRNKPQDVLRVHLAIAITFDDDVMAGVDRGPHPGHRRCPDALIAVVAQQLHSRILQTLHRRRKSVRGGIVNDEDTVHLCRHGLENRTDFPLHAIGRHDNGKLLPLDHSQEDFTPLVSHVPGRVLSNAPGRILVHRVYLRRMPQERVLAKRSISRSTASLGPDAPRDEGAVPLVTIIVVNFNGEEFLHSCLRSILAGSYPAREIFVIDNASTDGSRAFLTELGSGTEDVRVIQNSVNLGFAGAANLGAEIATGKYLAIVNMDLEVDRGWLEPLVKFLETCPSAAAVNPLITLKDGLHINTAGEDIHVTGLGFTRMLGRPTEEAGTSPIPVPGVSGAAFLIRRDVYLGLGGMDSAGFLYHEDVNLSWMLRRSGFDLYCIPASRVSHDYSLSVYPLKLQLLERNRWAMLLAYLNVGTLTLLSPFLFLTEILVWGYCVLRGWSFLRAKAVSYTSLTRQLPRILARRRAVLPMRAVSDWRVLRSFRVSYPWGQFFSLVRERGPSRRQRVRTLPPSRGEENRRWS